MTERRAGLITELFPNGVPILWCPLLTHYDAKGAISESRMVAHLTHLAPFIKGFLIPGSTGDGWELREKEARRVIDIALDQAPQLGFSLLIGILKPDAESARQAIREVFDRIMARTGEEDPFRALLKANVCGFAVCPPTGKDLPQEEILSSLESVLEIGAPMALYQLPQVTRNEMSPETVKDLADRYANLILFKDSSGSDRVALSRKDLGGVFKMRGAETDYCKWIDGSRVRYDGFLLSTTNCFAPELSRMIELSNIARDNSARELSERVSAVIIEVFQIVSPLRAGNAFANANKAMDHLFAYGSGAMAAQAPRLHNGSTIPADVMRRVAEVLARHDLLPQQGYLQ